MKNFPIRSFALFLIAVVALQPVAMAGGDCKDKLQSDNYLVRAPMRLLHGVVNAVGSPLELIMEPINSVKYDSQDLLRGIGDGLGKTVKFLTLGLWDVATFWVPSDAGKEISVTECVVMDLTRNSQCCSKDTVKASAPAA